MKDTKWMLVADAERPVTLDMVRFAKEQPGFSGLVVRVLRSTFEEVAVQPHMELVVGEGIDFFLEALLTPDAPPETQAELFMAELQEAKGVVTGAAVTFENWWAKPQDHWEWEHWRQSGVVAPRSSTSLKNVLERYLKHFAEGIPLKDPEVYPDLPLYVRTNYAMMNLFCKPLAFVIPNSGAALWYRVPERPLQATKPDELQHRINVDMGALMMLNVTRNWLHPNSKWDAWTRFYVVPGYPFLNVVLFKDVEPDIPPVSEVIPEIIEDQGEPLYDDTIYEPWEVIAPGLRLKEAPRMNARNGPLLSQGDVLAAHSLEDPPGWHQVGDYFLRSEFLTESDADSGLYVMTTDDEE